MAFSKAGKSFLQVALECGTTDRQKYLRVAADCFVQAGEDIKAAEAYRDAGQYALAAQHYRKAGRFDEAVKIVKTQDVPQEVTQAIIGVSRLHYTKEKQIEYVFVFS